MKKLLSFVLIVCTALFCGCVDKKNNQVSGAVSFYAIDGLSGLPISGVRIVLPESEQVLYTQENGRTQEISVPVIKEQRYKLDQPYGTFSVLGYKEGYNDYALFFAQVYEDQRREIKVYMFLKDTPLSNGAPLSTVESPQKDWVKPIVEKYRN